MNSDRKGKMILSCWIKQKYGVNSGESDNQYESWDLSCGGESAKIAFEVKYRLCPSTKYDDSCCEVIKVNSNLEKIKNGTFKNIYLASIYSDGIIRITSMTKDYVEVERLCKETTEFERDKWVMKKLACFTNYKTFKIKETTI